MKVQASGSLQGREPSPQQLWTQLSPCAIGAGGWGLLSTAWYTVGLSKLQQKLPTLCSRDEASEEGEENREA